MTAVGYTVTQHPKAVARGLARTASRNLSALGGLRGQVVLVLVTVVALVAAGAGMLYYQVQYAQAVDAARSEAAAKAPSLAETVLTYDYRTLQQDLEKAKEISTGGMLQQYGRIASGAPASRAKKQQVVTQAAVIASGVTEAEPDRVETLLFVTLATQNKTLQKPRIVRSEARMTLTKVDGKWLVAGLKRLPSPGSPTR